MWSVFDFVAVVETVSSRSEILCVCGSVHWSQILYISVEWLLGFLNNKVGVRYEQTETQIHRPA